MERVTEGIIELEAREGVRLSLYTGMLEYGHADRMATLHFYRSYPGGRLVLLDACYEFGIARYSLDREDIYIYTYAYQPNETWTTYLPDLPPNVYGQDVVCFEEEGFFRVNLRRKDRQEIDASEANHINQILQYQIPEDVAGKIVPKEQLTRQGLLTSKSYFAEEIRDTVEKLQMEAGEDTMLIPMLTDSHYTVNGVWEDTIANLQEVRRKVSMDALIHLGDMTDGMVSRRVNTDYVNQVKQDLNSLLLPIYIVMGNHDTNYFQGNPERFSKEEQYWLYQSDCCDGAVRDGHALYYYRDFDKVAVRAVFLHSFDETLQVRYGFAEEEVAWLERTLASVPEGYRILVFSHVPPLPEIHFWSKDIRNGDRIVSMLEEDMRKRRYTVLGWIHGHNHADQIYRKRAFPIISLGCTKIEDFKDRKPEHSFTPDRKFGEVSQELWNVLVIKKDSSQMKLIRFGAGEDAVI